MGIADMNMGLILRKLFSAYVSDDPSEFLKIGEEIIEEEERKNNKSLARDLREILYNRHIRYYDKNCRKTLEIPCNKKHGIPLIEPKIFQRNWSDISIDEDNKRRLEKIIHENITKSILKTYGLNPSQKVLLCGPAGCGKMLAAEVLSSLLIYPMAYIRLDGLISSNVDEISLNLRKIFDFISKGEWLVFFESFDIFGKRPYNLINNRSTFELTSILLQLLDNYEGDSLIIAAAEYPELLDESLRQKFDEIIFFDLPDSRNLKEILKKQLRSFKTKNIDYDKLVIQADRLPPEDIEIICIKAIKDAIFARRDYVDHADLEFSIERHKERLKRFNE